MRRWLGLPAIASLVLVITQASAAHATPIIEFDSSGTDLSGRFFADFLVQDAAHGLATVDIFQATNLLVVVPGFVPGTINPVIVRATTINQAVLGLLGISATDLLALEATAHFVLDPVSERVVEAVPVPEPAGVLLLAVGLVEVARRRWTIGRARERSR